MSQITIVGTGLIGTSLALALQRSQQKDLRVVGTDSDHGARGGADKRKAFDKIENRLNSAVRDADIVILATPVLAMKGLLEILGPNLKATCVVTDVGSSKKVVLDWAEEYLPNDINFVGGHPMAGKETAGPQSADADLFVGKTYCVVPGVNASEQSVREVTTLAEIIGAKPFFIGVDEHDSFVAGASHLPFLLSMALVGCTSKSANWDDIAQLASSGYRDISRLASGDTVMHRDICVSNSASIVPWIDSFIRELYEFRKVLDTNEELDGEAIKTFFDDAFVARSKWMAGEVNSEARNFNANRELPTFAESMSEMFMGRKAIEATKKIQSVWGGGGKGTDPR